VRGRDQRSSLATTKHDCRWRAATKRLEAKLAEKDAQLATVTARLDQIEHKMALANKQILGPKRERMPTPEEEAKKREPDKPRGGYVNPRKRKENAEALESLPTTIIPHPVAADDRRCSSCGEEIRLIGTGDRSVEYEWVPGRVERRVHVVEVGRCPCKQHYARGPAPRRVREGCTFGPGLLAKLALDKCADSTPIYRVEKQMRRCGVPIARSTLNDNVLLAGELAAPLIDVALEELRIDPHLQADETSVRLQRRRERAFVWTFISKLYTVYVFSLSRSGDTPKELLEDTTGTLTVDGYTGYNTVTDVNGRDRTGCWSHARRYLFDALPSAPEARQGLDIILELFMIEREAQQGGIVGTSKHLRLRKARSRPVLKRLDEWREKMMPLFEPKSAMGEALRYMKNQWTRLTAFVRDPLIPLHNNASEAALRIVALFRKNSLFFGNEKAARRLMVLYSLIAMCERHDVNPEAYLTDVLLRIQDQPKSRLAELLPHRWKETFGSGFTVERIVTPGGAT
jgi:transposase